ncbi:MAG: nitroreductase family deazaflavin-dependent oxidoreductase [Acidimicrobiia bacterium]|nr:MAG: nitroreductase family deazaflavin-dependent oxidoreductase [Acidimicrobiia bacterium]
MSAHPFGHLPDLSTVDLTTWGRRSGLPRRIEIWMVRVADRYYITGTPGRRDWLANVRAKAEAVIHTQTHDVRCSVREVTEDAERRSVMKAAASHWYRSQRDLSDLVAHAPMIELAPA